MAVATTTALAIGGLAISAGSTAMSFAQASKQSKLQRDAEAKAAKAMAEARAKLNVNFAKNLSIQKEPYELAREAMLSSGAQVIQAGVESDRGAEVSAGKVQMAQNQGQADIRSVMGQELTDINKQIINEDSRLRDLNVQLDLGEVEGAQLAARDAQEAKAAAMNEGFQGVASTLQQGLDMVPLYQKNKQQTATANPSGAMTGTGSAVFNKYMKNQPPTSQYGLPQLAPMPQAPMAPVGFGQFAFKNNPLQAVAGSAPKNPLPGTADSYGPFGLNWSGVGY
jgi:hypothetical protein